MLAPNLAPNWVANGHCERVPERSEMVAVSLSWLEQERFGALLLVLHDEQFDERRKSVLRVRSRSWRSVYIEILKLVGHTVLGFLLLRHEMRLGDSSVGLVVVAVLELLVLLLCVIIDDDGYGLGPMRVRPPFLHAGNPILLASLGVEEVAADAAALCPLKSEVSVVDRATRLGERHPADARICAIDVAVLVLDIHQSPRLPFRAELSTAPHIRPAEAVLGTAPSGADIGQGGWRDLKHDSLVLDIVGSAAASSVADAMVKASAFMSALWLSDLSRAM